MRKFEVELDIHFSKTLHIEAPDEDAATVLAETMLLCTDAMPLTDADMIGLITTATELGKKPVRKARPVDDGDNDDDDDDDDFCCGDCAVCGLCDEDEEDRIDELVHKLMEALEDATDAMGSALKVADALKEITGEDIFTQMMK